MIYYSKLNFNDLEYWIYYVLGHTLVRVDVISTS